MAAVVERVVYDKPLGAPFGAARLYAVARYVTGGDSPGVIEVNYFAVLDANPPTAANMVPMEREDFLAMRLLRNLAVP